MENKTASSAHSWEKDGPVIGALDSELRILCSRPGQVKVLCPPTKKFYLQSASLHPVVSMGTGKLSEKPDEM